jgi:hypothetical protein
MLIILGLFEKSGKVEKVYLRAGGILGHQLLRAEAGHAVAFRRDDAMFVDHRDR